MFLGRECAGPGTLGSVLGARQAPDAGGARPPSDLEIGIESVTQAVETLSGGQRQGVAVARRGVGAAVMIMDEPTAALGVKETRQVLDLIRRVRDAGCRSSSSATTCRTSSRSLTASRWSGLASESRS